MGYSPESVIEFYEDSFVETTPENKTEHKNLQRGRAWKDGPSYTPKFGK